MGTLVIQGAVVDLPDGSVSRTFDLRVPCSPSPSERIVSLASDAPFDVSLDGMAAVHAIYAEADQPFTLRVDSAAGSSQSIPAESVHIISRAVAITAIALVRAAGQATTVRLILGQEA
jgi:hypothetical protein